MTDRIVTANRLADGAVVFRTADGGWSTAVDDAECEPDPADGLLVAAEGDVRAARVVGPYLIDIERRDDRLVPTVFRERVRAEGPTIHLPAD